MYVNPTEPASRDRYAFIAEMFDDRVRIHFGLTAWSVDDSVRREISDFNCKERKDRKKDGVDIFGRGGFETRPYIESSREDRGKHMLQANPLRVGLIGAAGRWGPRAHVPALKGIPETELYAVCTAHADTAQAAAEKFGIARAYGSDKELNADPQVEAVSVAVRVPAHFELTKNAIEAGKHVFCEWPLGANTKQAEELAARARKKNVRTMVGLQRRASPAYLYMRELIQQGYVGQVLAVNMMLMASGVLTRPSDRTWQRDVTLGANTLTITFGHV
jgi:hypothetical protein